MVRTMMPTIPFSAGAYRGADRIHMQLYAPTPETMLWKSRGKLPLFLFMGG
ncbi:hypothetical protein HYU19_00715 [Candidatus Woesearchaeota archaeon]|nr:hypothetical protein [Candidatus Woesearchaeota archaeon]